MTTLGEAAQAYEPKQTKNIAELDIVDLSLLVEDREGEDKDGLKFNYKVIVRADGEYRVPGVVLGDIKQLQDENIGLTHVKVTRRGTGLQTTYAVFPAGAAPPTSPPQTAAQDRVGQETLR